MGKQILVRLENKEDLLYLIEKATKKLGITKSGLARVALHEYCNKVMGEENGI